MVNSIHHQAVYPWGALQEGVDFHVLGWTTHLCKSHEDGYGQEVITGIVPDDKEIEICYFPTIKGLGIQHHPEMLYGSGRSREEESTSYMRGVLDSLLDNTLLARLEKARAAKTPLTTTSTPASLP